MKPYYQDQYVTLYLADCRDGLAMLHGLGVDIVLTDPPYGVGIDYGGTYDDKSTAAYWQLMTDWFIEAKRITRLIVFTPGAVNLAPWVLIAPPHWVCAWYHNNACSHSLLGGFLVWEPILVYGKPDKRVSRDAWNIPIGRQASVGNGHPVPKPEKLFDQLVNEFTTPGQLIVDPFLGSGTTAWCAKKLGRRCIGFEVNEAYLELAARRCSQATMGIVTDSCNKCYTCGNSISNKRADSDYCSNRCRQAAYRQRRNMGVTDKVLVSK